MTDALDRAMTLQEACVISSALRAARNVGLLAALTERPSCAREAAAACGIDPRGAEVLLHFLTVLGVVTRREGRYRVEQPLPDLAVEPWDQLESRLCGATPEIACDTAEGAAALYPENVEALASMFSRPAARLAEQIAEPGLTVADLGAGAAGWSLAMHRRAPSVRVTAIDLPEVIATTRAMVARAGAADAFSYIAGDLFESVLPDSAFDLVLAGLLCHLFGEERNRLLIRRAHRTLRPGGAIAIVDVIPDPRGRSLDARRVAGYELSLLLRTSEGRVHPFSSYAGWLSEAGFEQLERIPLPGGPLPLTLVRARKRTDA